jgi:hypothetical protein
MIIGQHMVCSDREIAFTAAGSRLCLRQHSMVVATPECELEDRQLVVTGLICGPFVAFRGCVAIALCGIVDGGGSEVMDDDPAVEHS